MAERNGGVGLEGLLRGIGDLLHQAANLSSDLRRAGQQDSKPTVESRMTIRTLGGEEIGADFFGLNELVSRAKAQQGQPEEGAAPPPPERREVVIDIFSDSDAILAVAELPGAAVDTLKVTVEQDMLAISAEGPGIEYQGEALLPAPVDNSAREQSFRNGVLELRWPLPTPQP